jgi:mannan endo-1,4-beta-mannosidase
MKNIALSLLALVTLVSCGCKKNSSSNGQSDGTTVPPVTTVAPKKSDTVFLADGVNLQPSYYNKGNVDFGWNLMKQQANIKSVRINIEPTDAIAQVVSWISNAKANGYKIVACYHKASVLGSDDANELILAANWWKTNYAALGGGITVNLMNEWGSHNITASAYATAYNNAIAIVRTVYSGPIIIDIPGYGQETLTAYQAVKTSTPVITDANIVLSTHIYPGNYNQGHGRTFLQADLDEMTNSGRTCMVGEFGTGTGSCDWSGCVDYAKLKNWTVMAWAWNGDGNDLNMVTPSWATNPTASSFTVNAYFSIVYAKL